MNLTVWSKNIFKNNEIREDYSVFSEASRQENSTENSRNNENHKVYHKDLLSDLIECTYYKSTTQTKVELLMRAGIHTISSKILTATLKYLDLRVLDFD